MASFSEHLRKLMGERKMSAAELARATGLSEAAVSGYLNGKKEPRSAQSISIARALGVTLDELWQTGFQVKMDGNKVTVTAKERELLERVRLLNDDGMVKAEVYIDDLINSGHDSQFVIKAAAGTAKSGVLRARRGATPMPRCAAPMRRPRGK